MAPVRSYTNWNSRTTDEEEQIEPYRKYFFICEGANTETWYFKKLIDIRKELNIHPLIDIRLLEKTEGDRDISFPRRLIEFAENQKENPEIAFDKERDKMIVVFDGDIFEEKVLDYDELVAEGEKNNILAVSNPAFELFLLLHYENSYEDDIEPNAEQIIQNEKDGHQTFIYKLLFPSPAPIRLLTSEPVVAAKELTITKKTVEILLIILDTANCTSPNRAIATKKRNHGITLMKACIILHTDK